MATPTIGGGNMPIDTMIGHTVGAHTSAVRTMMVHTAVAITITPHTIPRPLYTIPCYRSSYRDNGYDRGSYYDDAYSRGGYYLSSYYDRHDYARVMNITIAGIMMTGITPMNIMARIMAIDIRADAPTTVLTTTMTR